MLSYLLSIHLLFFTNILRIRDVKIKSDNYTILRTMTDVSTNTILIY